MYKWLQKYCDKKLLEDIQFLRKQKAEREWIMEYYQLTNSELRDKIFKLEYPHDKNRDKLVQNNIVNINDYDKNR